MATRLELREAFANDVLRNKVGSCIWVAAEKIRVESDQTANHVNRLLWARDAFKTWESMIDWFLPAMLAANESVPLNTILTASDDGIQTAVDNVVDIFATGS